MRRHIEVESLRELLVQIIDLTFEPFILLFEVVELPRFLVELEDLLLLPRDEDGELGKVVLGTNKLDLVEAILDEVEIGARVLVGHEELLRLVRDDLRYLVDVLAETVSALFFSLPDTLLAEADALGLVVDHVLLDLASLGDWAAKL